MGLKTARTLWVWGNNGQGRLGLGDVANRSSPVQVGSLTTWTAIVGTQRNSFALKSDGTLWTWGHNGYGQLGLGDVANRSSPVQVGTGVNWTLITGGNTHTLALN